MLYEPPKRHLRKAGIVGPRPHLLAVTDPFTCPKPHRHFGISPQFEGGAGFKLDVEAGQLSPFALAMLAGGLPGTPLVAIFVEGAAEVEP